MASACTIYAVLWSEEGRDVLAGKLELVEDGLSFGGCPPGRGSGSWRSDTRPRARGCLRFRIGSVGGAGVVSELGEQLAARSGARR